MTHPALAVGKTRLFSDIDKPKPPADVRRLPLWSVSPSPNNPRSSIDEVKLEELATSIRERGLQVPIRVRRDAQAEGTYIIVGGHRRFAAHQRIGATEILAIVCDERYSEADAEIDAVVDNLFREDMTAVDYGDTYRRLLELWKISQAELARRLSVSTTYVSRMIAVSELPEDLKRKVSAGELNYMDALRDRDRRTAAEAATVARRPRRRPAVARGTIPTPFGTVKLKRGKTLAELVEYLRTVVDQEKRDAA
jgi:ParB family chromosome partitioning protein